MITMQETSRYAVGVDIGTTTVRAVVGHLDPTTGMPTIVGVGQAANTGMRKGVVANLSGPAQAIDAALGEAERMSGYQVDRATVSINGTHILSTHADGMVAVGSSDHVVTSDDVFRVEEVATTGKIPANREILEVIPHAYRLDGQDNIKDPVGMNGTRLEIDAHVVSVLTPHLENIRKVAEMAKVASSAIVPSGLASARSVLGEQQLENGVALVDIGGSTTSIAVYEEGDLQYTAVLPYGGIHISNDLAIGLKVDLDIAEQLKLSHASAIVRTEQGGVTIKHEGEMLQFQTSDIDEIVEARLEEIFIGINNELKKAGRAGRLPSGVVLTGGTAQFKSIAEYAKSSLGLAARIGKPKGFSGFEDRIERPDYATVIGLMLLDAERVNQPMPQQKSKQLGNMFSKFMAKFNAES